MYWMKTVGETESMRGSLNSAMDEPLMAIISELITGHQELTFAPDGIPSGTPAAREALSDLELRDLRVLRGFIF
jgi:hypothetical protein